MKRLSVRNVSMQPESPAFSGRRSSKFPQTLPPILGRSVEGKSLSRYPYIRQASDSENNENTIRLEKVKGLLATLEDLTSEKTQDTLLKHDLIQYFENISTTLDSIFSYYGINIFTIKVELRDSAARIEAATSKKMACRLLYSIAELISKVPYTFLREIGFNKITLCGKVTLLKEDYKSLLEARVLTNAMFPIYDLKTFERIERHFSKLLLGLMQRKDSNVGYECATEPDQRLSSSKPQNFVAERLPESARTTTRKLTYPTYSANNHMKQIHEIKEKVAVLAKDNKKKDQLRAMGRLITNPKKALDGSDKAITNEAKFIRQRMEIIDPIGANSRWWIDLSCLPEPKSAHLFKTNELFE